MGLIIKFIYTLSLHINMNFVILDDHICIYKAPSELVSSTLCSLIIFVFEPMNDEP